MGNETTLGISRYEFLINDEQEKELLGNKLFVEKYVDTGFGIRINNSRYLKLLCIDKDAKDQKLIVCLDTISNKLYYGNYCFQ